jgi:hypothetical protein
VCVRTLAFSEPISLVGAADVVANTLIPASIVNDAGTSEYTGLQEGVNAK